MNTFEIKFREWTYWHIGRPVNRFWPWLGSKIPKKIAYWVVVSSAVKTAGDDHPGEVTALDMLKNFNME